MAETPTYSIDAAQRTFLMSSGKFGELWVGRVIRTDHRGADVEKSDVEARLGRRQVRLATRSSGFTVPTIGRWESFNWRVVERGR